MVIYIDVLIAVNILIDYFLLLATSRFLQLRAKRLRMVGAAFLGGVSSLLVLLPQMHFILNLIINLLISALLLWAAFGKTSFAFFAKTLACFYGMSLLFSGVMTVLWFFAFPSNMVVNNGKVYFHISPIILIVLTAVSYTVMRLIYMLTGRHELKQRVYPLTITVEGKTIELLAMADTGNSLRDVMSHAPVIVAEYAAVEPLIPEPLRFLFRRDNDWEDVTPIDNSAWNSRFRFIPFKAVYANGLLPAFRGDKIFVKEKNRPPSNKSFYIAVCNQKLSLGNYNALFNPELLQ